MPETGQLWADVGRTALDAGKQIQESALNPAVREKMKLGVAKYQQGEAAIAASKKLPHGLGMWQWGIDANGEPYMIPPAQGSTTYQSWIGPNLDDDDQGKGSGKGDEKPPVTAPGTEPTHKAAPPAPPPINTTEATTPSPSMFAGRTAQPPGAPGFQGPTQAQTASAVQEALQRNQFASSEQGVPAGYQPPPQGGPGGTPPGTFLNPATGNIEPLQQQQPPGQPAPPQQPGSAISQITQQPGVALANWQNQNVHPVIAPKAVLDAVKTNVSTAAQDATYLPSGGVNGEPAWAIHMKGGGQTTISASQLATSPWGRALMATHNASEVMEAQANQPPQPQPGQAQTNQPGNMLLQAPPGQAGQPPAAPSIAAAQPQQAAPLQPPPAPGMPADQQAALAAARAPIPNLGAYTNVPSQGGPQNLTAQNAPAGQPARPGQPPPQVLPIAPADAPAAIADLDRTPDGPVDPGTGDTRMKKIGNLWYYRDNSDTPYKGRYYTALPGTSTWTIRRAYIGDDGYHEVQLPDTVLNENLQKEVQSGTGPPELKTLTTAQILGMHKEEKQAYLDYAKSWHNTGGQSNSETNEFLAASLDAIKQIEQAKDIVHVTPNPAEYSDQAKDAYRAYKANHALINDPNPGLQGWVHHVQGRIQSIWSGGNFPASDDMGRTLGNLATDLKTKGLEPVNGMVTPATGGWSVDIPIKAGPVIIPAKIGKGATAAYEDPMDIPAIKNLTQGGTSKEDKIARLQQLEDTIVTNLHNKYHLALTDNERVDLLAAKDILNTVKAGEGKDKPLTVPDNIYRDAGGKRRNPYTMPQVFDEEDLTRLKNQYGSGKHFIGPDEDGNMKEYVTP